MGGTVSEAMKAVVSIDHSAAAPGPGRTSSLRGDVLLGPEGRCISAHWRKAYKLSRRNKRVFNQVMSDRRKTGHKADVARDHLFDAL
eukprot:50606-Pyramimonas_sp.AAC.1